MMHESNGAKSIHRRSTQDTVESAFTELVSLGRIRWH